MWESACSPRGSSPACRTSIGAFAPVASVAAAALSFGVADVIGGSGFLAVYLVGLAVGSTPSRYRRHLVAFHEGIAFLAQVALFVVLGLLVFPSELPHVAAAGLALALALVLVCRPAAVWASTWFSDFTSRERLLLGWAGLRGAVPIVLATFVLSSRRPAATPSSTPSSSSSSSRRSSRERPSSGSQAARPSSHACSCEAPLEVGHLSKLDLIDFAVAGDHAIAGAAVRELGLPRSAIVAVVVRGDDAIPPRGSTLVRPGDHLFVLAPRASGGRRRRLRTLAPPGVRSPGRDVSLSPGFRQPATPVPIGQATPVPPIPQ